MITRSFGRAGRLHEAHAVSGRRGSGAGPADPTPPARPDRDAARREAESIAERYARRAKQDWRYDRLNPAAMRASQDVERALAGLLRLHARFDRAEARVVELGCGHGDWLLGLLRLGFRPQHLRGVELLPDRAAAARARLPADLRIDTGDALAVDIAPASQDLALQFTVFSSVLDAGVRRQLAATMWRWLRPGGAVLWYDFTVDNPRNPDVRGVPARELRSLFPEGRIDARRLTLAPPIARAACRLHPALHDLLAAVPLLRTHCMAWIAKP